jgi:hypothetical protein
MRAKGYKGSYTGVTKTHTRKVKIKGTSGAFKTVRVKTHTSKIKAKRP